MNHFANVRKQFVSLTASLLFYILVADPAQAQNPNPNFQGFTPWGTWIVEVNGLPGPALIKEGDEVTLEITEHQLSFCGEGGADPDNCITSIRWDWFDRRFWAPFNNGVAWSVLFEHADPDVDCRNGQDYRCTFLVKEVTQNGDVCGIPKLTNIAVIQVVFTGDAFPNTPNTRGLPYILSNNLWLDIGEGSCPPMAAFNYDVGDPSSGGNPLQVSFDGSGSLDTDNRDLINFSSDVPGSTGIVSWEWDFGDGNIGFGATPVHTYSEPGDYDVVLTVTDDESDTADVDNTVQVMADIDAEFTYSADPANPLKITFDAAPSNSDFGFIEQWYWTFGDGEFDTDGSNSVVMHTYEEPGQYAVELFIQDDLGNEGEILMVINVGSDVPVAQASYEVSNASPLQVIFNGANSYDPDDSTAPGDGIDDWSWDFGDGNNSNLTSPNHTYPDIGVYNVGLTVVDNEGDTGDTSLVVDLTYDVNADLQYTIDGNPLELNFDGSGSTTHPGATIVSYEWDFGDGSMANEAAPTHTYQAPGEYTVHLTVTDDFDQNGEADMVVNLAGEDPIAVIGGGLIEPDAANAVFNGTASYDPDNGTDPGAGIVLWEWDFGDGFASSGENVNHTYDEDGTYTVSLTVTDDEDATGTATLEVVVDTAGPQPFVVKFRGGGPLGSGGFVGAALEALGIPDAFGDALSELIVETKYEFDESADPFELMSRLCGNLGADCPFQVDPLNGKTLIKFGNGLADMISCDTNPTAPWCTSQELAPLGMRLSTTAPFIKEYMDKVFQLKGRAEAPPSGGMPEVVLTGNEEVEMQLLQQKTSELFEMMSRTLQLMNEAQMRAIRNISAGPCGGGIVAAAPGFLLDLDVVRSFTSLGSIVGSGVAPCTNAVLSRLVSPTAGSLFARVDNSEATIGWFAPIDPPQQCVSAGLSECSIAFGESDLSFTSLNEALGPEWAEGVSQMAGELVGNQLDTLEQREQGLGRFMQHRVLRRATPGEDVHMSDRSMDRLQQMVGARTQMFDSMQDILDQFNTAAMGVIGNVR